MLEGNLGNRMNIAKRRIQAALRIPCVQPLSDLAVGEVLAEKLGYPILPSEIQRTILEVGEDTYLLASWGPPLIVKAHQGGLHFASPPKKHKHSGHKKRRDSFRNRKPSNERPRCNPNYEPSPNFYESDSWRHLRYEVLKKCGRRCLVCGRGPAQGVILHVDHIKPRSRFPLLALDPDNLQVLCEDCNLGKSNRDSIDWRP